MPPCCGVQLFHFGTPELIVFEKQELINVTQNVLLPDVEVVSSCVMLVFIVPDVQSCCSLCTIVAS